MALTGQALHDGEEVVYYKALLPLLLSEQLLGVDVVSDQRLNEAAPIVEHHV